MNKEHIFIIDDDKFFAKYFIMKFRLLVNSNVEFHHFSGLRPVFTASTSKSPLLIFLDNELNGELGVESIPELLEIYEDAEIILMSASNNEELKIKALRSGASQFICKDTILMDKIAEMLNEETSGTKREKLLSTIFNSKISQ